ncbi:MAG: hypothetical protein L7W95_03175 [Alphaproteobacteria bacterium]|jgi:hypothetical protein|nr:hypothetical protein [Alphaproteobacteria bacterium]
MATEDVEFVAILTLRYMEPHLMGLAHDWVEQNAPKEIPGATRMRSFHIAPDRGMSIIWFESQEALDAQLPMIKEFQNMLAEKFQGRAETQKGMTSPDLQFGD